MYGVSMHNIKEIMETAFHYLLENQKRTLAKTAIYRGSTTVLLFTLGWVMTGNLYETSLITIVFNVIATAIYYFHERMWGKISWGMLPQTKKIDAKYAKVLET